MCASQFALSGFLASVLIGASFDLQSRPASEPPKPPAAGDSPQTQPDAPPPARPARGQRPGANFRAPDDIQVVRDVVYAEAPGSDGKNIELKMDTAFLKQSDGKPLPVVVYIHGGGWSSGFKEMGLPLMMPLARGGYFAVTIDYRLTGQATFPAAVYDCKAAVRFIRSHAEELGIDPNRIAVWGHSAGGHLSALLGTSGNSEVLEDDTGKQTKISSAVQCVVDISGPIDMTHDAPNGPISQWLGGPVRDHPDLAKQASPLTYIDANDPPVLIVQGSEDRLVSNHHPEVFEKALKEAGVPVEYLLVEGAGHGANDPKAYIRVAEFFDEHLHGHATETVKAIADQLGARRQVDGEQQRRRSEPGSTQPTSTRPR